MPRQLTDIRWMRFLQCPRIAELAHDGNVSARTMVNEKTRTIFTSCPKRGADGSEA